MTSARGRLLLGFDLEDWHQLSGRDFGQPDWDRAGPGLVRQLERVLDLLDQVGSRATFFVLGITAKNYPDSIREVHRRGHEIACHGFSHTRLPDQTADGFRRDLDQSLELLDRLGCGRPRGYRAPAFSLTRECVWALETLADYGFEYDSSLYDSPRVPRRMRDIPAGPFRLRLPSGRSLCEFPPVVARFGPLRAPVAGGSYWRFLPARVLSHFLDASTSDGAPAALYFHPYEYDPEELKVAIEPSAPAPLRRRALFRNLWYNVGRRRIVPLFEHVSDRFEMVTYETALENIRGSHDPRQRSLSSAGVIV